MVENSSRSPSRIVLMAISTLVASILFGPARGSDETRKEFRLDLDGDGRADRAWIVPAGGGDAAGGLYELHIALGSGQSVGGGQAELVVRDIASWVGPSLESPRPGALEIRTCMGCGANRSTDETITVIYRDGKLMAARFRRAWEWSSPLPDDPDNVIIGGCDVDFLTGAARVSTGLDEETAVPQRFAPVALSDWSVGKWPAICRFAEEG